jgi:hypothetical protein
MERTMSSITAETTQTIDAPAALIYDILADYRHGHPQILPEKYFSDLVVEEGGHGEGTVIRFHMHLLGSTRTARARVAEPEPGRVLTETYPENAAVTTFRVQPLDDARSSVTITTSWNAAGVRGLLERWLVPPLLQKIYRLELANLRRYTQQQIAITEQD